MVAQHGHDRARLLELDVEDGGDRTPAPAPASEAKPWQRLAQVTAVLALLAVAIVALVVPVRGDVVANNEATVSLYTTKRVCHINGGCECTCSWANSATCAKDERQDQCCFNCCCQGHLAKLPPKNGSNGTSQVYRTGDQVQVLQVSGAPLAAVVQRFVGAGMYSVKYTKSKQVVTASEQRLVFQHSDMDSGKDGGSAALFSSHTSALPQSGVLAIVFKAIGGLLLVAALAVAVYFCSSSGYVKPLPIREGAYVVVTWEFQTDSQAQHRAKRGDRGQILRLDGEYATIDFYDYDKQRVHSSKFNCLKVASYGPVTAPARIVHEATNLTSMDRSCVNNLKTRGCLG